MDNSEAENSVDQLEPWKMFSNDMVADDEVDENNLGNTINEYEEEEEAQTPEIKPEPEEVQEEQDTNDYSAADIEGRNAAVETADDDDTLFNFGHITRSVTALTAVRSPAEDTSHSDASINYNDSVVFICPACGAEFDAQDTWKRHMNKMHSYNTRQGLNFRQLDKLYHQCMECHKHIAMHSMENLLKHKFTHLPYRCTKCRICHRQYKYRQDLMVHLRMTHRDELIAQQQQQDQETLRLSYEENSFHNKISRKLNASSSGRNFEIKDIKENAIDIFEGEDIEVKNELIEPDDMVDDSDDMVKQISSVFPFASYMDDTQSRSSSHASEVQDGSREPEEEVSEKHVQFTCPQCGLEYHKRARWREHIEIVHDFGTKKGLNFRQTDALQQCQCLECKAIVANSKKSLQQHKFSHLRYKAYLRCKICFRSFMSEKDIVTHMKSQHHLLNAEPEGNGHDIRRLGSDETEDDPNESLLMDNSTKSEERDGYEIHIDYLCPQCGKEFLDKKLWRKHIVKTHRLTDLQVLNFRVLNERQLICLECDKIITNAYGVQNAQQHRITHMPYKAFVRCRKCAKSYTDRKGLVKHLRSVHRIGEDFPTSAYPMRSSAPSPQMQLQRPAPTMPPKHISKPVNAKRREIVRHADVTFVIQYLDDDDDVLDNTPVPELAFNNSFDQFSNLRCVDCASIFANPNALQAHIKKEHEIQEQHNNYKSTTESSKTGRRSVSAYARMSNSYQHPGYDANNTNSVSRKRQGGVENAAVPKRDASKAAKAAPIEWDVEKHFFYLCPACGDEFNTQMDWRRHINTAHNFDKRHSLNFRQVGKHRYQCIQCKDIVSNPKLKGLQDHKFRHLPFKLYIKCRICGTCYNHKPNMVGHLERRHNIVDSRLPRSSDADHGYKAQEQTGRATTATPVPATATVSKPPGLKTVEDYISFHNAVDHDSITYFCPQCNENFDSHVFWRKHIVEVHNLNSRYGLNFRQIDDHHYLCLQCYKRVTVTHTKGAIGQLQSHKFRHLPYKSFKCLKCNGEFVRKQMFFKHLNKMTNRCESAPVTDQTVLEALPLPDEQLEQEESPGISQALIVNEVSFVLICPQCGEQFDSQSVWHDHINLEHCLSERKTLNFRKLKPGLHQCIECNEAITGSGLHDLQVHKFKHLASAGYIQCKFCDAAHYRVRSMQEHLRQKHPNVVQKHEEYAKMAELLQFEETLLADNNEDCDMYGVDDDQYLLG